MGYRNHLHVCQHCGIVHATSSETGPKHCVVCGAFTFSGYELNELLDRRAGSESRTGDVDDERVKLTPSVVRY